MTGLRCPHCGHNATPGEAVSPGAGIACSGCHQVFTPGATPAGNETTAGPSGVTLGGAGPPPQSDPAPAHPATSPFDTPSALSTAPAATALQDAPTIPPGAHATVDFAGGRTRLAEAATLPPTGAGLATRDYNPADGGSGVPDLGPEFRGLLAALAPPREPGEIGWLGPYRVLGILGAGGMGVVFRAEDPQLRREIALKTMRPELAASPENLTRFLREARATAALQHDHIVPIFQASEDRGIPFIAMPLLRGMTLEERLAKGPGLTPAETLRIGREAAEGLAEAHRHGMVHRDIKPANMWLESPGGRVKLLDFGLVRSVSEDQGFTRSGVIVGTPAYMSPEQTGGRPVDHRCDLFSLGCVLYRLATGRNPFQGSDAISILVAVASAHPSPPRDVEPSVLPELSQLIMDLLEKDPAARPASAPAVAEALAAIEGGFAPPATPRPALPGRRPAPALKPAPAPAPGPARRVPVTQPRPRASGCTQVFAGCGVLSVALIAMLGFGMVLLAFKTVPWMIRGVKEGNRRQADWAKVLKDWKPPPADAGPDRLFPAAVAGLRVDHHDTRSEIPELGIHVAGKHALYGQGETAVDVFVYRVTETEKVALYKAAFAVPSLNRTIYGSLDNQQLTYRISPPDRRGVRGVTWWNQGWLFGVRSTAGADPEAFLLKYLTEVSRGASRK